MFLGDKALGSLQVNFLERQNYPELRKPPSVLSEVLGV